MGLLKNDLEKIIKTGHQKVGFFCVECAEQEPAWVNILGVRTNITGNTLNFKIECGVTVPANHIAINFRMTT